MAIQFTARGYPYPHPDRSDTPDVPRDIKAIADRADADFITRSSVGTLPAFGVVGRRAYVTDLAREYLDIGTAWVAMQPSRTDYKTVARGAGVWQASISGETILPLNPATNDIEPRLVGSTGAWAVGFLFRLRGSEYVISGFAPKCRLVMTVHASINIPAQTINAKLMQASSIQDSTPTNHPYIATVSGPFANVQYVWGGGGGAIRTHVIGTDTSIPTTDGWYCITVDTLSTNSSLRLGIEVEVQMKVA